MQAWFFEFCSRWQCVASSYLHRESADSDESSCESLVEALTIDILTRDALTAELGGAVLGP
jgi:hypothetical protein